MKTAVVFYSLSNNTKDAAIKISKILDADLIEVKTVKELTGSTGKTMMWGGMQSVFGKKPAIKPLEVDVNEYDEIIIGAPIWAGKQAPPISTFLAENNVQDKVIGAFTFSMSGNDAKCIKKFNEVFSNIKATATLLDAKYDKDGANEGKIAEFIEKLK